MKCTNNIVIYFICMLIYTLYYYIEGLKSEKDVQTKEDTGMLVLELKILLFYSSIKNHILAKNILSVHKDV